MNTKILLVIGVICYFLAFCSPDNSYLNNINFRDSTLNIQDSMKVMNQLLIKMSTMSFHPQYYIRDDTILITVTDSTNIRVSLQDSVYDSHPIFNNLSKFEINQFQRIVRYLNDNYLSSAIYDKMNSEVYLYSYHDLYSGATEDARYIVLLSDIKLSAIQIEEKSFYRLIQIKRSLALYDIYPIKHG